MKKILYIFFFVIIVLFLFPIQAFSCYAIVVGKGASYDGSVLLGHAEQNEGFVFCNFRMVPRIEHKESHYFTLQNGGKIPYPRISNSYFWSELYGFNSSDAILNEYGVACVSNSTPTKEDPAEELIRRGDITDGGICLELRLEVAKRAKSAREGVKIIGNLVNYFGYLKSGTTHVVADPNEAWIVTVICGKHWIAQRVPDNEVVVLANVNIIQEIDLSDTSNFLGSDDLVSYALKRGWYSSKTKKFNFKEAYDRPNSDEFSKKYNCDPRQWRGLCLVTGKEIKLPVKNYLPFSVIPRKKLTISDIKTILSDHLEGTIFDKTNSYQNGSPHKLISSSDGMICNNNIQEVAVFQLRNWLPKEIGCIYWKTSCAGCSSVLLPWYLGIIQTPEEYWKYCDTLISLEMSFHYNPPEEVKKYSENKAFYIFNELENLVDIDYIKYINFVKMQWDDFEKNLFDTQPFIEKALLDIYSTNRDKVNEFLTFYCSQNSKKALLQAKSIIKFLKTNIFKY